jgi:hypothetical protein
MRLRFGVIGALTICLLPAGLALDVAGCNDGSTGCCVVCAECACGNQCVSCADKCTSPKGCYCGSTTALTNAALSGPDEAMSLPPDAGERE